MLWKTLARATVVSLFVLIVAGCDRQPAAPSVQEEPVMTAAEYRALAEREITEENMDAELEALEKAIEAEAAQIP